MTMKKLLVAMTLVSSVFLGSVSFAQPPGRIFQVAVYSDNRLEHHSYRATPDFIGDTGRGGLGAMYKCELLAYPGANIKSVEFTNVEKKLTFKIKRGSELIVPPPAPTLSAYVVYFGKSEEDVIGDWVCTVKYRDGFPEESFSLTVNDILRTPDAEGFRAWFENGVWNVALRANIGLPQGFSQSTNVQYLFKVFSEDMHEVVYARSDPVYDGRENLVIFRDIPAEYSGYIIVTEARLWGFGAAVAPQGPRPSYCRSVLFARLP
jgi:hypothetical protein